MFIYGPFFFENRKKVIYIGLLKLNKNATLGKCSHFTLIFTLHYYSLRLARLHIMYYMHVGLIHFPFMCLFMDGLFLPFSINHQTYIKSGMIKIGA